MSEMKKMWAALEAHQTIADKLGYGTQWARMCSERTAKAANAARGAAWDAAKDARAAGGAAGWAAWAAEDVSWATVAEDARSGEYAEQAIDLITKANQGEQS